MALQRNNAFRTLPAIIVAATSLCALLLFPSVAAAHQPVEATIARATADIEENPGDARLYLKRGELHRVRDEHALAEADYARAAALDPDDAQVDFYRGRLFLDAGQPAKAEAALSRFIARIPDDATARMLRARALVKLDRPQDAVDEYTAAIGLHGGAGPDLYLERAQALAGLGDAQLEAALRGLDEGLSKLGPVVTLELYAIELEEKRGHFDAALARLDRITQRSPRKDPWLARRGQLLEQAGRPAEAREAYEQALNAISELPDARRTTAATADSQARLRVSVARLARPPQRGRP